MSDEPDEDVDLNDPEDDAPAWTPPAQGPPNEAMAEYAMERARNIDEWKAQRSRAYEAQMVKRFLVHFNLRPNDFALRESCRVFDGSGEPSFLWLLDQQPTFPLYLVGHFIPYAHQMELPQLFKRFHKTPLYAAYETLRASMPDEMNEGPAGVLLPWGGLGDMILHDYPDLEVKGARMSWLIDDRVLYLDHLGDKAKKAGFLYGLSKLWSPDL